MARSRQQELAFPLGWGGKRKGAGRKPKLQRPGVSHRTRHEHQARHPVHVTLRAARRFPSLRKQTLFVRIRRAFAKSARTWFRVLHFSVQADHVHLLVEANDKRSLARGVAGLAIRVARSVNQVLCRRGRVWHDRYHARPLRTPREVRIGIIYVVQNFRKHARGAKGFDVFSSAWWLDGWRVPPASGPPGWKPGEVPVEAAQTWLAAKGWKPLGLIQCNEAPKGARDAHERLGFAREVRPTMTRADRGDRRTTSAKRWADT